MCAAARLRLALAKCDRHVVEANAVGEIRDAHPVARGKERRDHRRDRRFGLERARRGACAV